MRSDWRQSTWGDEISLEYGKALRGYKDSNGDFRVYGSNGPVGWTTEPLADGPGVILGRKGAYRGVEYSEDPFYVIDTAYYVAPKTDLDMRWLYYAIVHHKLGEIDDGSPIPSTTRAAVYVRDVAIPEKHEQERIAHILGTLDDKIELNRRMNRTLEAMAQAIFKSWFVDFEPVKAKADARASGASPEAIERAAMAAIAGRPIEEAIAQQGYFDDLTPSDQESLAQTAALFPDSFQESEVGDIPEGWKVETVDDIAERVAMGPFGSSIKVSTFVDTGIPVISGQHLKNTLLEDSTFNYVTPEHAEKLARSNVYPGDIVFTHAGSIGQVSLIPESARFERYVLSQRQFYLRCNTTKSSPIYLTYFFRSRQGQHLLLANASQVGVPSIARPSSYLKSIPFVNPSEPIRQAFGQMAGSLFRQISTNINENGSLLAIRDTLLPRLLSGNLEIPMEQTD